MKYDKENYDALLKAAQTFINHEVEKIVHAPHRNAVRANFDDDIARAIKKAINDSNYYTKERLF